LEDFKNNTLLHITWCFKQVQKIMKSIRAFLLINKAQLVFKLIFSNSSNPSGTLCREFDIWAN
jgi:hypothetical protein